MCSNPSAKIEIFDFYPQKIFMWIVFTLDASIINEVVWKAIWCYPTNIQLIFSDNYYRGAYILPCMVNEAISIAYSRNRDICNKIGQYQSVLYTLSYLYLFVDDLEFLHSIHCVLCNASIYFTVFVVWSVVDMPCFRHIFSLQVSSRSTEELTALLLFVLVAIRTKVKLNFKIG